MVSLAVAQQALWCTAGFTISFNRVASIHMSCMLRIVFNVPRVQVLLTLMWKEPI